MKAARQVMAAAVRQALQPERYLSLPLELGDNAFMPVDERLEDAARRILQGTLMSCGVTHTFAGGVDWTANPTPNRYKEWTWQLNRHREWVVLAERYRQTGDEPYAAAIVRFFRSWFQQAIVPEAAPGQDTDCWRTIEAGIRMSGPWPWALHSILHSESLTDDDLVDWCKSVWEHGWRLRHFHRTGNWLVMEMNGLAHIGILFPHLKDAAEWKRYALDTLARELEHQVHPDGFQYELSTHTQQILLRNYQRLEAVCRLYDKPVPGPFHTVLERMFEANVKMMMPDGRLPNVNNGGWHELAPLLEPAVTRYPQRRDFLWAASRAKRGTVPPFSSVSFPHAGYHVMRANWSTRAVWGLFDGGPLGYRHHQEDKLNVLIHAYGRMLLTDAGKYHLDCSEMHRYTLSSQAHNTTLVNGQGQNRRRGFVPDEIDVTRLCGARWYSGPALDLAEASYAEGYGPNAERDVTHTRRVVFLKRHPVLTPCFLVIDRLISHDQQTRTYEALWHLDVKTVRREGPQIHTTDENQANLAIITAPQPGLESEIVWGGHVGWKVVERELTIEAVPIPTAVYRWRAKTQRRVTLLYPLPENATCPVVSVLASAEVNDTIIQLALDKGPTLEFDELQWQDMLGTTAP